MIVGAGPAGSTAAISFMRAEPDLRVALVDKAAFPRDKACGDGLGPGVIALLDQLGLAGAVDGERQLREVEVRGPRGAVVIGALPSLEGKVRSGVVIERRRFDNRLHAAALEAGVTDLTGWRFTRSEAAAHGRTITVARDREEVSLSASLLVGADGAGSRVRDSLGIERNGDGHTGIGIRAYADVIEPDGRPPDRLILEWSEPVLPGYGWVFPLSDGRSNIGAFMRVTDRKKRGVKTVELLDEYIHQLTARGYTVTGMSDRRTYILPNAAARPRLISDSAALIGDAASMINPWSGEGIFYAIAAADILAAATSAHVRGRRTELNAALADYERRFRSRFSRHFMSCTVASHITRSGSLSAGILRAADQDREIFDYLVALMFGEGVIEARMLARILPKGLWNAVRRRGRISGR